jgi:hypothetical protein
MIASCSPSYTHAILDGMPVENRLQRLSPEEVLRRFTPEGFEKRRREL